MNVYKLKEMCFVTFVNYVQYYTIYNQRLFSTKIVTHEVELANIIESPIKVLIPVIKS